MTARSSGQGAGADEKRFVRRLPRADRIACLAQLLGRRLLCRLLAGAFLAGTFLARPSSSYRCRPERELKSSLEPTTCVALRHGLGGVDGDIVELLPDLGSLLPCVELGPLKASCTFGFDQPLGQGDDLVVTLTLRAPQGLPDGTRADIPSLLITFSSCRSRCRKAGRHRGVPKDALLTVRRQ